MPIDIELPHNGWLPRPHQAGLWRYLQGGGNCDGFVFGPPLQFQMICPLSF